MHVVASVPSVIPPPVSMRYYSFSFAYCSSLVCLCHLPGSAKDSRNSVLCVPVSLCPILSLLPHASMGHLSRSAFYLDDLRHKPFDVAPWLRHEFVPSSANPSVQKTSHQPCTLSLFSPPLQTTPATSAHTHAHAHAHGLPHICTYQHHHRHHQRNPPRHPPHPFCNAT